MEDPPETTPSVLIARRLLPAGLDRLPASCEIREGGLDATPERLHELARGVDAIVSDPTVRVDEALLEAAGPQLKVVANFAVGYERIDLDACRRRGIAVTNTPDVLTNATSAWPRRSSAPTWSACTCRRARRRCI